MSLFALRHEYQRSFDRIFEDYSVSSRAQTEHSWEEVPGDRHQSVIHQGDQPERNLRRKTRSAITPRLEDGYEFIHRDLKAWGCFLDSKLKE